MTITRKKLMDAKSRPWHVIAAMLFLAGSAVGAPIQWWVTNPLEKIRPTDLAPAAPLKRAELYAARNEFEPFQLVLRAGGDEERDIDVDCSNLRGKRGEEISKDNVNVYAEGFVNVTHPSLASGLPGEWPDPLIPRVDRYTNEKRNAFPFSLARDRNQPVWIEIFVPSTTAPGEYTGTVSVLRHHVAEFTVPIRLTVWAFVLPSTSTLKSSFGLNGTTILKQHLGHYTSDEDLYRLTRLYEKAALLHRVSVHGGSQAPPKHRYAGGRMLIDWDPYDAEVGPFLDGTALDAGPLRGAKATSVELRGLATFDPPEQAAYWAAWMQHFEQKGWRDKLFLYLWDEPAPADYAKVLERGRVAITAVPNLRTLVTAPFSTTLAEAVRIWAPLINCLERKPGSEDFCAVAGTAEDYAHEVQHGKSLWFYQSCASHGCGGEGGPYFEGWPSYMIDASGPANRVMQWVAWNYRIDGELYYSMNEAYAHGDPWTDVRLFGGNGDGTLFYPGLPSKIGGNTHIPIESIRLKLIREGMEDYEYLTLLTHFDTKAAAQYAARIVQATYSWETRPNSFLQVRRELGEALQRLEAAHLANRSNAP